MKKLSLALLMAFAIGACAGTQTKTRSVLDTISGTLIMANSFINAVEGVIDIEQEGVIEALIGAKQHLLVASEYLEDAYSLLETNPETALKYVACSRNGLVEALGYAKKMGVEIPKGITQSLTSAKEELGDVVCGKLL